MKRLTLAAMFATARLAMTTQTAPAPILAPVAQSPSGRVQDGAWHRPHSSFHHY